MKFYSVCIVLISLVLFFIFNWLSKKLNLIDYPNIRKQHKNPVPYTGGICISVTFLMIIYMTNFDLKNISLLLSYGFLISLVGLIDDKLSLQPGNKLVLQILPVILIIYQGIYLTNIGDFGSFGVLELGSFDKVFTILAVILFINAFNYSDGSDGISGFISIIILATYIFYLDNLNSEVSKIIFLIMLPILVFLLFNLKLKIFPQFFLGDSGSLLLGFIIGFLSIELAENHLVDPLLIIWPLSYLIYEFLSTNIIRVIKNKSLVVPGSDHLHYELNSRYKNKYFTIFIISTINLFFILLGNIIYNHTNNLTTFISFIIFFIFYFLLRMNFFNRN